MEHSNGNDEAGTGGNNGDRDDDDDDDDDGTPEGIGSGRGTADSVGIVTTFIWSFVCLGFLL